MKIKKILLGLQFVLVATFVQAQVKVGNNPGTINPSAVLEVESTNKGFLPPRVALTSTTDISTIPSPATGLFVFNTTAAGSGSTAVEANRLYFWDGTRWTESAVATSVGLRTSTYGYKYFTIDANAPTNSLLTVGNISVRWPFTSLSGNQPLQVRFNDQPDYAVYISEQGAVPSTGTLTRATPVDWAQNTWTNIPFYNDGFYPANQDWAQIRLIRIGEKAVYRIIAQFNYLQNANATTGRAAIPAGCTLIVEKLN